MLVFMVVLMKYLFKFFGYILVTFFISYSNFAQEINENGQISLKVQNEINAIEDDYDKNLANILSIKNSLDSAQLKVMKVKNSLILLNDLPLPIVQQEQLLDEITISLSSLTNIEKTKIEQKLDLINVIKNNFLDDNTETSVNIENLFIDILSFEENIKSDLNDIKENEFLLLKNKIENFSEILNKELDLDSNNLVYLQNKINKNEIKKAAINSRLLIDDENIFDLIKDERIEYINNINFILEVENKDFINPEIQANNYIESIKDEIVNVKSILDKANNDAQENNIILIEKYNTLKKLYKAPRYGEYLITIDGSLIPFNEEETKIKKTILDLENNKSRFQKEIISLKTDIVEKDKKVKEIFKEASELNFETIIVEAAIKRMVVENDNLKSDLDKTKENIAVNDKDLITRFNTLEKLYKSTRIGDFILTENGSLISFKKEEVRIKNEIELIEKEKDKLIKQIENLSEEIENNKRDIKSSKNNKFIKAKNLLTQKKTYQALHEIENNLEADLLNADNELKEARLEGDINKINQALKRHMNYLDELIKKKE